MFGNITNQGIDYIDIGSTPFDEDCLPAGDMGGRQEALRFKRQCEIAYPPLTNGNGWFSLSRNEHDFGTYWTVVAKYYMDTDGEKWALKVEHDAEGKLRNWTVD
jgi:hypothetical protein